MGSNTVKVGTYRTGWRDRRRRKTFEGELIHARLEVQTFGGSNGLAEYLYERPDGRLLVHSEHWTCWRGDRNRSSLVDVTEEDLGERGLFAELGRCYRGPLEMEAM